MMQCNNYLINSYFHCKSWQSEDSSRFYKEHYIWSWKLALPVQICIYLYTVGFLESKNMGSITPRVLRISCTTTNNRNLCYSAFMGCTSMSLAPILPYFWTLIYFFFAQWQHHNQWTRMSEWWTAILCKAKHQYSKLFRILSNRAKGLLDTQSYQICKGFIGPILGERYIHRDVSTHYLWITLPCSQPLSTARALGQTRYSREGKGVGAQ